MVDILAKKIIEIVTAGIHDPREIADTAIRQLGARPGRHPGRD
jgi:hypothetical protein